MELDEATTKTIIQSVERKITTEGLSLVQAVYAVHESLVEQRVQQGLSIICRPGCSNCCRVLVTVTPIEWLNIVEYLKSQRPDLIPWVIEKTPGIEKAWLAAIKDIPNPERDNWHQASQNYYGTNCPFLSSLGECAIYEARPYNCRNVFSVKQCEGEADDSVLAFPWGRLLGGMLCGKRGSIPLPHLLPTISIL